MTDTTAPWLTEPEYRDFEPSLAKSFWEADRAARPARKRPQVVDHDNTPPVPEDPAPPPSGPEDYGHVTAEPALPDPFVRPPLSIVEWQERELLEPDSLLGDWMTTTSRALLVAPTGLGKTNFVLQAGLHIASGVDFLHWRGRRPARVLYVDGEMSRRLLKQRILDGVHRLGLAPEHFNALSHEDIEGFAPLNTQPGQVCIDRIIADLGGVDLVMFDSVMCLTVGDMKDEESWQQTMPWVRSLTRRSIGQIWVHHTGHDETRSYGTKTREWQLDTVLQLETVKRDDTDVSFSLQFRKARERTPATRADFQDVRIALVNDRWEHDAIETKRPGHVSPAGQKFLEALQNATASGNTKAQDHPAATTDEWRAECIMLGLIDPETKANSARTLFNKYRRELVGANRIGCQGDLSWSL